MGILKKMKSNLGVVGSILKFLWKRKLWWMIPFVLILLLFAIILIFAQTTGLGPFIYTLF